MKTIIIFNFHAANYAACMDGKQQERRKENKKAARQRSLFLWALLERGSTCLTHHPSEDILKLDESCISNPKSENLNWTGNNARSRSAEELQSDISDFGFEMQDSSNFIGDCRFQIRRQGP